MIEYVLHFQILQPLSRTRRRQQQEQVPLTELTLRTMEMSHLLRLQLLCHQTAPLRCKRLGKHKTQPLHRHLPAVEGRYASVIKQSKIGSYITKPASVSRTKKNNLMLIKMIVKDMQPFSAVEDQGFREYIVHLDPSCQLPSRRTLTRELLPWLYDDMKEDVETVLSGSCVADH